MIALSLVQHIVDYHISVYARISVCASSPTIANSVGLSVGAARALSTKIRMCILADPQPALRGWSARQPPVVGKLVLNVHHGVAKPVKSDIESTVVAFTAELS